nr:hypothetical protein [Actinomycetales bacterium]
MELTELKSAHATSPEDVLTHLDTDAKGLTAEEAASRLEELGPNKLPEAERPNLFVRVFRHFNDPLIYLLLAAAVVMAITGHWIDTWVILVVVVVTTNPVSWITVSVLIALQLVYLDVPFMQTTFGSHPLNLTEWGITIAIGSGVFVIVEIEKWVRRRIEAARETTEETT